MSNAAPRWGTDPKWFADELLTWLASLGATRYDESVTQFEHALQSAALARAGEAPQSLVIAALLHDVGHLLACEHIDRDDFLDSDLEHESIGAIWLARGFGPEITEPIRLHVDAKRYLCAAQATYRERLSASSQRSLLVQGGPMDESEVRAFRALPYAQAAVALRRIDDAAKVPGMAPPPALAYRDALVDALVRA